MICKNCGKELDDKAVICTNCGCSVKPKKKPFYKKWWFWVLIVLAIIIIAAASSGEDNTNTNSTNSNSTGQNSTTQTTASSIPSEFAGDCPITLSAAVADNIIGVPELSCHIKNNTDKEIAAIKLYFAPKDVYGKDINTWVTTNELTTDEPIDPHGSCTRAWQMLDTNVKSGDVYVYSVYFSDGTEWGDKDASTSKIKKYGLKISATN